MRVDVYGADDSSWVQAVLLGLHDARISHSLTSLPPLETFRKSDVTHRADSAALFWGGFSLAGDCNPSFVRHL
jgi:hypothetical protein